jgi:hypothetical protein
MAGALSFRQEHFDARPQQFFSAVSEDLFRPAIRQDDPAAPVDADNRLRCRLQQCGNQLPALLKNRNQVISNPGHATSARTLLNIIHLGTLCCCHSLSAKKRPGARSYHPL